MKPLAARIQPRPTPGADRVDVNVFTGASGAAAGLAGVPWEAAIVRRPRLSIEIFSPTLDGKTSLGKGDLVLGLNRIRRVPNIKSFFWLGAPITLYDATGLDLATAPIEFTGYVRTTSYDVDTDQLTLNFEVSDSATDRPLLFKEFSGGGGLSGDPQLRGTLKPAGFGSVKNIEPVWFDNTRNIGMIDGYGNCVSIDALFEGGNDFGAKVADYADYATLAARIDDKTVPPGRWASAIAQGLVGLGAPPVKPITVDAVFGTNRPGAVMQRLLTVHAALDPTLVDTTAFDGLDAAIDRPVHHWTSEQRTVKDLIEALAASCNATPLVTFQGKHSVSRAFGGALLAAVDRQAPRRATRVTKWRALDPDLPVWRMRARAGRPGTTLTIDQINYADTLIDRGVFDAATVYRQGNLVWGSDGAQWLYVNATAAAGNALPVSPATSNAFWEQTKPPTTAADLTYADGTPIEDLKPAAPGADVTGDNTAAAIAGQGDLATQDSADFGTQVDGATKPEDNADVTSSVTGPTSITITADYLGAITTVLPFTQAFKLIRNGVDVTTTAAWSVTVDSGVIAASIGAATGILSLDESGGVISNSSLTLSAVLGTSTRTLVVKVVKQQDAPPTTGGGGSGAGGSASSGLGGSASLTTTPVAYGHELDIVLGSAGDASLGADYTFTASGSVRLTGQFYRWNGTAWAALGSPELADTGYINGGDPGDGSVGFNYTGGTPGSSQRFQLFLSSNFSRTVFISGGETAVGS